MRTQMHALEHAGVFGGAATTPPAPLRRSAEGSLRPARNLITKKHGMDGAVSGPEASLEKKKKTETPGAGGRELG